MVKMSRSARRAILIIFLKILVLAIALGLQAGNLVANPLAIPVSDNMQDAAFTQYLEVLGDPEGKIDFEQILSGSTQAEFHKVTKDSIAHIKAVLWFRGILENHYDHDVTVYFQFDKSSHITLAQLDSQGQKIREVQEVGWKKIFRSRGVPFLMPTFEIVVPPGKLNFIIKNEGPRFYFHLGSKGEISESNAIFEIVLYFCIATFLSFGIFNFFIFTRTRDNSYLLYSIRCMAVLATDLVSFNILSRFVLTETTFNPHRIVISIMTSIVIVWIFVSRKFLSLDQFIPKRLLNGANIVLVLGLAVAGAIPWTFPNLDPDDFAGPMAGITFVTMLLMGIYVCFKRYRPAYFYLPAQIIYFTGVVILLLSLEDVLPVNLVTALAPPFAGAIEALLMSFALGDKYMTHMKLANSALSEKNLELDRNLSFMFKKLDQGIFSIDESGKISSEHSDYLKTILLSDPVAGKDAFDILFKESDMSNDAIEQIRTATLTGIGEDPVAFELNSHVFPREVIRNIKEQKQVLEVDWQPLINQEEKCEKIMVVLRDVTSLRNLKTETESNQKYIQIVGQVLSISLRTYEKFSKNTLDLIAENAKEIDNFQEFNHFNLALMFRNIHTIKGNARTFGLTSIADTAHEVENYFSDIRTGVEMRVNPERLRQDLKLLEDIVHQYDKVLSNFLNVALKDAPEDLVLRLTELYAENTSVQVIKEKFFAMADEMRLKRFFPTLEEILTPVLHNQVKMATELAKPTPHIHFRGLQIRISTEMETCLRNIFTQILRNSIDHGIESPEQRAVAGKQSIGEVHIEIDASLTQKALLIEIYDDGAGLNLAALAKKCENPFLSDEDIADTIFHTGVSTVEKVTQISGRGVGMDIVKDLVIKNGGSISIQFTKPKTLAGRRPFKFILHFPSSYVSASVSNEFEFARDHAV